MKALSVFGVVCLVLSISVWAQDMSVPPKSHPDSKTWQDLFKPDLSDAFIPNGIVNLYYHEQDLLSARLSDSDHPKGIWIYGSGVLTANEDIVIWTKKDYRNCIIDLEFKTAEGANSGVFVYGSDMDKWIPNSVEIQILDDSAKKWADVPETWKCAAIFGHLAASKSMVKRPNRWNRMTITCQENMIYVMLNGEQVTVMDMKKMD